MSTHGMRSGAVPVPRFGPGVRHFARHYGEMVLVMVLGMFAFGMVEGGILAAAGTEVKDVRADLPAVFAGAMAVNMTIPMAAWMRHRGHSWPRIHEMAAAMLLPSLLVIVLFWCSVLHEAGPMLGIQHTVMLPAMLGVMLWRRAEYSRPVHAQ